MTRNSSKRYRLFRKTPTGEVKSWSTPMRLIDVRRAVYCCLADNGAAEDDDAQTTALRLEQAPHMRVACGGYTFWVEAP